MTHRAMPFVTRVARSWSVRPRAMSARRSQSTNTAEETMTTTPGPSHGALLFQEGEHARLTLTATHATPAGVAVLIYEPTAP
jgi:hypothetical protein